MAVTPNTTFTIGDVLTASQQNRFGRGIMATPSTTVTGGTFTAEAQQLTTTFAAVSGRMYFIVYSEPVLSGSVAATCTARLREDTSAGTTINQATVTLATSFTTNLMVQSIFTAAASGSKTVVATLQASTGTGTTTRSSIRFPQLYVIDIGAS
jgi:hypothetical protein